MSDHDVDLFVIGAGSGGVRAARIAANFGARVAIAEEDRVGGTCVIRGCVPKKLLVHASHYSEEFEDARGFGWNVEKPRFSWPELIAAKDREISRISEVYTDNMTRAGAKLMLGSAKITGPNQVMVDGREYGTKYILVATGGAPVKPAILGIDLAITSTEVFELAAMPRRILVVGGGYI